MLIRLLVLALIITPTALLFARFEYRKRGRLSVLGLFLLMTMVFVPNLMLEYATENDWSAWCLVALLIIASWIHLLILVEEEHLARTFGEQYATYCRTVPRYL